MIYISDEFGSIIQSLLEIALIQITFISATSIFEREESDDSGQ